VLMPIDVSVTTAVQRSRIEVRDIFIGTNMPVRCGAINGVVQLRQNQNVRLSPLKEANKKYS
jgi:hypothetical protein